MSRLSFLLSVFLAVRATPSQLSISNVPLQTTVGIGASGAWWPIDLYRYPDEVKDKVASLLFSADGMGLTSYRYNIGGGGVFVGNPSRAPETPYVAPGVYNWSADPQGTYFLRKAAEFKIPVLTAFVNSAPPAFTSNNRSCGGFIVDAQIPAYAQYVADVIAHWRDEGVVFTHVSPMNEPDNGFSNIDGVTPCDQEGMVVLPTQRAAVVNALRTALDSANLTSVGIMADETSWASEFIPEAPFWLPSAKESVAAVCHHDYGFANDVAAALMGTTARSLSGGKDTWFTEICCFGAVDASMEDDPTAALHEAQGYEPTMVGALQMANLVYQSLTVFGDVHFDWWTALSSQIGCDPSSNSTCVTSANTGGWNDGLIYYDSAATNNSNFAVYPIKRFYAMKHLAKSIPIGSVRHNVQGLPDGVKTLAFQSGDSTSLIAMNMGSSSAAVDLSGIGTLAGAWQTTDTDDWATLNTANSTFELPGLSMSSFSLK